MGEHRHRQDCLPSPSHESAALLLRESHASPEWLPKCHRKRFQLLMLVVAGVGNDRS